VSLEAGVAIGIGIGRLIGGLCDPDTDPDADKADMLLFTNASNVDGLKGLLALICENCRHNHNDIYSGLVVVAARSYAVISAGWSDVDMPII